MKDIREHLEKLQLQTAEFETGIWRQTRRNVNCSRDWQSTSRLSPSNWSRLSPTATFQVPRPQQPCGAGLLLSLSVLILDQYIPGEWF
jgi:hypothetical protein